jgi:predicted nuclease with TOPRIM domain
MADDVGSVAAWRVALQAMSERCERLQSRLDIVEKENLTIKTHCTCQTVNNQSVQINIKELSCKKEQLVEYLRIVTNENRTLWTKLSALDCPAVYSNDKIKPKNSLAIIDNYLKYNGMCKIVFILNGQN